MDCSIKKIIAHAVAVSMAYGVGVMAATPAPEDVVQEICNILRASATQDYIGEPVSQLEHMLQAADFAAQSGADDEMVLAALLHDIGHLDLGIEVPRMGQFGVSGHQHIGAKFLSVCGFSARVVALVRGHVQAKRYRVSKDPEAYDKLSEASKKTLEYQGGAMTTEEAATFEADPLFSDILKIRDCDDLAKQQGKEVPLLQAYEAMMLAHLRRQ